MADYNAYDHPERRPGEALVRFAARWRPLADGERWGSDLSSAFGIRPVFGSLVDYRRWLTDELARAEAGMTTSPNPVAQRSTDLRLDNLRRAIRNLEALAQRDVDYEGSKGTS